MVEAGGPVRRLLTNPGLGEGAGRAMQPGSQGEPCVGAAVGLCPAAPRGSAVGWNEARVLVCWGGRNKVPRTGCLNVLSRSSGG